MVFLITTFCVVIDRSYVYLDLLVLVK